MDMFVLGAVAVLAAMAGFWAGRSVQWQLAEAEGVGTGEGEDEGILTESNVNMRGRAGGMMSGFRDRRRAVKILTPGREIVSPATGQVSPFEEEGRQKIRILPDQGKVYAPASCRISKLYPMGSALLLQTEFGADILMKIGNGVDEMCSNFYRCRVMEHEIVRKGTLILEYDPAAISLEGANPEIVLSVENDAEIRGLAVTGNSRLRAGDPLLYVNCKDMDIYEARQ